MRKFNNARLQMMYGLFEEFDQSQINDELESFKKSFSYHEINANNILFDYFNAFLEAIQEEGIVLDCTYETLPELNRALETFYQQQTKKYLPFKAKDLLAKTLASYLTVMSANMHALDITYKKDPQGLWADQYSVFVNGTDLLPVCLASVNDNGEIDIDPVDDLYHQITAVSLKDHGFEKPAKKLA